MKRVSLRILVIVCATTVCIYLINYVATPIFLYSKYNNKLTFENLDKALSLSPSSPGLNRMAGDMYLFDTLKKDSVKAYNYYLKSLNGGYLVSNIWGNLSIIFEEWNYSDAALKALETSHTIDPLNDKIIWALSQKCFLKGDKEKGYQYLSKFLALNPDFSSQVYDIVVRVSGDYSEIYNKVVPKNTLQISLFLNYLISQREKTFSKKVYLDLKNFPDLKSDVLINYMNYLIREEDTEALKDAFDFTIKKLHYPEKDKTSDNMIYNNSFEFLPMNGGYDWVIIPAKDFDIDFDKETKMDGDYSLRVEFKGTNTNFQNVFQSVDVSPGTNYKLSFYIKTEKLTTINGFFVEVLGKNINDLKVTSEVFTGTNKWQEVVLDINIPENVKLIALRLRREVSSKFDNKITGIVWVDRFRLSRSL